MENAVEALKMAFAVIVLMMALSVSIFSFSNVKEVSDIVLYSKDETNYYEYQGAIGKAAENRIVGLETIIPTLYKYYKENYTVLFRKASYDYETGTFDNIEELPVYTTKSIDKTSLGVDLWGSSKKDNEGNTYNTYEKLMNDKYSINLDGYEYSKLNDRNKQIFSFDLEEETLRHEPWTGNYDKARENISCFLSGGTYKNPNNNTDYIEYEGFVERYANKKFVETIGEYEYSSSQANSNDTEDEYGGKVQAGSTVNSLVKSKKKRIIIFTLINN